MVCITPFKRGFAFYPFMFIPKRLKKGTAEYSSYVTHETIHYYRQGWLSLFWIIRYFFSKKFRWQEEKLAFTAEIIHLKSAGKSIDEEYYIKTIAYEYWGMVNELTAKAFIRSFRA